MFAHKMEIYISDTINKSIYCSDGNLARAYGLPKIHKPGFTINYLIH